MTVTVTQRNAVSGGSTQSASQTSGSFTPAANSRLYVWAVAENNNSATAKGWSISNTAGLSFSTVLTPANQAWDGDANYGTQAILWVATVGGSPASMTVTVDAGGSNSHFYSVEIFDVTSTNPLTVVQAKATSESDGGGNTESIALTMDAALTNGNTVVALVAKANDATGGVSTPTGFSNSLVNQTQVSTSVAAFHDTDITGTTVTISDLGQSVGASALAVLELNDSPSSVTATGAVGVVTVVGVSAVILAPVAVPAAIGVVTVAGVAGAVVQDPFLGVLLHLDPDDLSTGNFLPRTGWISNQWSDGSVSASSRWQVVDLVDLGGGDHVIAASPTNTGGGFPAASHLHYDSGATTIDGHGVEAPITLQGMNSVGGVIIAGSSESGQEMIYLGYELVVQDGSVGGGSPENKVVFYYRNGVTHVEFIELNAYGLSPTGTYLLKATIIGTRIRAWIDGDEIIDALLEDTSMTGPQIESIEDHTRVGAIEYAHNNQFGYIDVLTSDAVPVSASGSVGVVQVAGVAGSQSLGAVTAVGAVGVVVVAGVAGVATAGGAVATAAVGAVTVVGVAGVPTGAATTATGARGTVTVAGVAGVVTVAAVTVAGTVGVVQVAGIAGSAVVSGAPVIVTAAVGVVTVAGVAGSVTVVATSAVGTVGTVTVAGIAGTVEVGTPGSTVTAAIGVVVIAGIAAAITVGPVAVLGALGAILVRGVAAVPRTGHVGPIVGELAVVPAETRMLIVPGGNDR